MTSPRDGWDADELDTLRELQADLDAVRKRHEKDPPLDLLRAGSHDALPPELQADVADFNAKDEWSRARLEGVDAADVSMSREDEDRLLMRIQREAGRAGERSVWSRWLQVGLAASALAVLVLTVWMWRGSGPTPAAPVDEPARATASVPPETASVPRETGSVPRETGSVPRETGSVPRETGTVPRETGTGSETPLGSETKPPDQTAAAGATTASGPRRGAPLPPTPPGALPVDKPPVMLTAVALTWRGPGLGSQLLPDLKRGMDAYRKNNFALADREFAVLELRYPEAVEPLFFGGVSRLFLNEPARAIEALQKAAPLADETFAPEVQWYRALAEQRAGHSADARKRFDGLCRGTSRRAVGACEVLKQIDGR